MANFSFAAMMPSRVVEAIDFFVSEQDEKSLQRLIQDVEQVIPFDLAAYAAVAKYYVKKRSRSDLQAFTKRLSLRLGCGVTPVLSPAKDCRALEKYWVENLAGILFYESSSPALAKARVQITQGDCQKAKSLLEDVEAKEGPTESVFDVWEQMAKCEGQADLVTQKREQRKNWKIFSEKRNY